MHPENKRNKRIRNEYSAFGRPCFTYVFRFIVPVETSETFYLDITSINKRVKRRVPIQFEMKKTVYRQVYVA